MSTSAEYIEYVMDSISEIRGIECRYKKMFGEYCVYANDKPIIIVCDNTVFVKTLPCIESLMVDARTNAPYNGAKPHYLLDIDNSELVETVIKLLEENTPIPKPRKKR